MSEMSHSNGIYSNLNEASPALGRQAGSTGSFALDHSGIPAQDQFHDLRSSSPYGIPQSPAALPALPGHQPLISSLVYPDNGLAIMAQSGPGVPQPMRVLAGNGPSSELSSGSSGGYPDFPASPASWLDEVDHAQFWYRRWEGRGTRCCSMPPVLRKDERWAGSRGDFGDDPDRGWWKGPGTATKHSRVFTKHQDLCFTDLIGGILRFVVSKDLLHHPSTPKTFLRENKILIHGERCDNVYISIGEMFLVNHFRNPW